MINPDFEWSEFITPRLRPVLAKRTESRATFVKDIVVSVQLDDERVGLYLNQTESVASVLTHHPPTKEFAGDDIRLSSLHKYLYRRDCEYIFATLQAMPFHDYISSSTFVHDLVRKWHDVRLPGWIYCTMCDRGIALIKDFNSFSDKCDHCVAITDSGIAVFRSSIKSGCTLASDDRIFYMGVGNICVESLARISCWPDAIECCELQNSLTRWLFQIALEAGH